MSNVNPCKIVKDLLPFYKDGALGEETEGFVRKHIAVCDDCKELYGRMQVEAFERKNELDESIRYKKIAKRIRRRRIGSLFGAAGLLVLVWVLSCSMFQRAIVSGSCMEPTILENENYILNRWVYKIAEPKRNDIIVYESDGIYYMTRIVGLPEEKVEMREGKIYVDGILLKSQGVYSGEKNIAARELGKGEYFTIVDNPEAALDGTQCIKKKDIVGKVWITH